MTLTLQEAKDLKRQEMMARAEEEFWAPLGGVVGGVVPAMGLHYLLILATKPGGNSRNPDNRERAALDAAERAVEKAGRVLARIEAATSAEEVGQITWEGVS